MIQGHFDFVINVFRKIPPVKTEPVRPQKLKLFTVCRRIFAAHELMTWIDPATTVKMTVQFNLFGGTVFRLGTERHHHLLDGIDSFSDIGCFGLTELGFGNNAVEMETTATYSKEDDSITIHSPSQRASENFN